MKAFITAVCGIAVASGVLLGADIHDVVGNWEVTAIGWNGQTYKMDMRISEKNGRLLGSVSSPSGPIPLEDVALNQSQLTYIFPSTAGKFQARVTVGKNVLKGVYSTDSGRGGTVEARPSELHVAKPDEATFRRWAIHSVVPTYPANAARAHQSGIAVAEVRVDETGKISSVELLEAASPTIGEALLEAINQWQFKPVTQDTTKEAVKYTGKLTYYFQIINGKPKVLAPTERTSTNAR